MSRSAKHAWQTVCLMQTQSNRLVSLTRLSQLLLGMQWPRLLLGLSQLLLGQQLLGHIGKILDNNRVDQYLLGSVLHMLVCSMMS